MLRYLSAGAPSSLRVVAAAAGIQVGDRRELIDARVPQAVRSMQISRAADRPIARGARDCSPLRPPAPQALAPGRRTLGRRRSYNELTRMTYIRRHRLRFWKTRKRKLDAEVLRQ